MLADMNYAEIRVVSYGLPLTVEVYPDDRGVLVVLVLAGRVVGGGELVVRRRGSS